MKDERADRRPVFRFITGLILDSSGSTFILSIRVPWGIPMLCSGLLFVLSLSVLQVPPPALDVSHELDDARRKIEAREAAELNGLGHRLEQKGEPDAAREVRQRLPQAVAADGATRFVPLPEVVAAVPASDASPWRAELKEIQSRSAADLFALAQKSAKSEPPRYGLASQCLRAVLDRQPNHGEARRLLGFVPNEGGWAKPFAVGQLQKGYVLHPIFGWVLSDWVPHLDRGELPAPQKRGQNKTRWLPAAEADHLRAEWNPPWQISTEHFEIQTNVTLAESIRFGRRLEAFHDLFMTLMADILVEKLPLVRRFKEPSMTGEPPSKLHLVRYFASRDEYIDHLTPKYGQKIAGGSLGFYDPPKPGRGGRSPAYFFRDPNGQIPVTATLYHEVSHQLLFETAGLNAYNKNVGNYWVFEGLGTYFETVSPQTDGSLEVGGFVGVRMEVAIKSLVGRGHAIPLDEFVALGEDAFMQDDPGIYLRYQEAMALAVFLMQWHDGTYRDAFLDYVRDAYRGRIRGAARTLEDRLGQPYSTLDAQFLAFLKGSPNRQREPDPAVARPNPGKAIRTVPRQ